MQIGFIGAGRAGCSLGKYFSVKGKQADIRITGYYSLIEEEARWAAAFTESEVFKSADEVIAKSDTIILSTPDGAIKKVWESIDKRNIQGRIFCHLSGSLSSDVFSGIEQFGAYPISIHPMFAFSSKESVYRQLDTVCFTLEGQEHAISVWKGLLSALGNETVTIDKQVKVKYHAAASLLSNHVIAVIESGYRLLEECGFSPEEARRFSGTLVKENVEHVVASGGIASLTGPVERGDVQTVQKHLDVLQGVEKDIYTACGKELLKLSKKKNPSQDYRELERVLIDS